MSGEAGRAATLKTVAARAGVHVATASRALSAERAHLVEPSTRQRVQRAADELGYVGNAVARSLRTGATGTIGVVVADLGNPFIVAVLRGIEEECRPRGSLPLVAETHDDPDRLRDAVNRMLRSRVDAVILSAARRGDEEFVRDLGRRVPLVLAVRGAAGRHGGDAEDAEDAEDAAAVAAGATAPLQVVPDDAGGARAAVHHLVELGHRRIAQLRGTPEISSFADRDAGFTAAIREYREVTDVSLPGHAAESTVAEGRRLTEALLDAPAERRPTAVFAHNDRMAIGCLDALRARGLRCPHDVSVVGYNDEPLIDHLDPPLTTVRLPGLDVGRESARLAFEALAGRTAPRPHGVFEPELVVRGSTGAPARP